MKFKKKPVPLAFKPDIEEAARHWEAFYEGDIIDRPVVCVIAPKDNVPQPEKKSISLMDYYNKVYGDIDEMVEGVLQSAEATYYGGDAVPEFNPSLGPDEVAVYCGGQLGWSENADGRIYTNWSKPVVESWEDFLPIRLDEDSFLWKRLITFYEKAAEVLGGKVLLSPPDLHTNMDLLAALRGSERLCMDLVDMPEIIDRAMADAVAVFRRIWDAVSKAGQMDKYGYSNMIYSMDGAAVLQCDFSCMISPAMFRRWVLPALEEEAAIVKHVYYHWDGPGALKHANDIYSSKGLHTLNYVPGAGNGGLMDYIDLYKQIQKAGKSVHLWGTIDEVKYLHKELEPNKVAYLTFAPSQSEADKLLEWFVKNT